MPSYKAIASYGLFSCKASKTFCVARNYIRQHFQKIEDFDYPFYGGLPKNVSDDLTSDEVDVLQEFLVYLKDKERTI